jgi:hypothetical protein
VAIPEHFLPQVSQFTFPYLDREYEYRYITVEQRGRVGDDRWAIVDSPHCYNRVTGEWDYERRPSSREDDWMAQTRMTLKEALPLAERLREELKAKALDRISRILAVRVERAREDPEKAGASLEQALADQTDWERERKEIETV